MARKADMRSRTIQHAQWYVIRTRAFYEKDVSRSVYGTGHRVPAAGAYADEPLEGGEQTG